jgi:predicted ATPase
LLLVLDNCEHLIAAVASLTSRLIAACSDVQMLATSREALRISGEAVYRVGSLPVPNLLADGSPPSLDLLRANESMRLFSERALAASPSFALTDQNAAAVVSVCRQLDGIPLAIELAAARARALSPTQINERLADRFRLLTGGSRVAQPRQQTLRGAIDWSYNLLDEREQSGLRRLSVFVGGWPLEAAEAVCAGDAIEGWEVLDLLTGFVDKSLIQAQADAGVARYRMLETIRQYAAEKLAESGEAEAVHARHRDWYLALAEEAEDKLEGPEQAEWLERLESEHGNLRGAIERSLSGGEQVEAGLRLAALLWRFWQIHGHLSEGAEMLARALSVAPGASAALRADALNHAGVLARQAGDLERAHALGSESVALYRELGDEVGLGGALNNLGYTERERGNHARATELWEESLEIKRRSGDRYRLALALNSLGLAARDQGDYERAEQLCNEALEIFRDLRNKDRVALLLNNLAGVMVERGQYDRAAALCDEAFALAEELQDKRRLAWLRRIQGMIERGRGDPARGFERLDEALRRFKELNDPQGMAYCLRELAATAAADGRPADAVRLLAAETRMREAAGFALTPDLSARRDRYIAEARATLDAAAFTAAWAEGEAMSPDSAAAALRQPEPA